MASDIWSVADLLRGDYKRHEHGQVILPFTLLRRLDAVMATTREDVRKRDAQLSPAPTASSPSTSATC